ncbi:MAG TPA: GNAT family N-acetyltransferase [Chitinophagaceae bacterium]
MKVLIRQILSRDASDVARLCQQLGYELPKALAAENIKSILNNKDNDAFVALAEDKVIGWIGVSQAIQIESAPFCEIRGLIVDGLYRKNGIGKMLIEKAAVWGRERGNKKLRLRCNVKRTEAHLFYHHLNFKEIKEQKVFEIAI